MPTPTYTPLANITLSSTTAEVTFSSISQAYRDLVLVVNGKSATTQVDIYLRFNNDSSNWNYYVYATGNGSTTSSASSASNQGMRATFNSYLTTTEFNQSVTNIFDYSVTDKTKSTLTRSGRAGLGVDMFAGRYDSTSAITSITVRAFSDSFAAGSSMALYGIAA